MGKEKIALAIIVILILAMVLFTLMLPNLELQIVTPRDITIQDGDTFTIASKIVSHGGLVTNFAAKTRVCTYMKHEAYIACQRSDGSACTEKSCYDIEPLATSPEDTYILDPSNIAAFMMKIEGTSSVFFVPIGISGKEITCTQITTQAGRRLSCGLSS